jgi:hypothetical protein
MRCGSADPAKQRGHDCPGAWAGRHPRLSGRTLLRASKGRPAVSHAILFKIYFVDSYVIRQLERLKARVGGGDLYVIVDEAKGPVRPIPHNRVIRSG